MPIAPLTQLTITHSLCRHGRDNMGRKAKPRSSKYQKSRLPKGFYINRRTNKVTRYGEGSVARAASNRERAQPRDEEDITTTMESSDSVDDNNPVDVAEEFTCTTPPKVREKLEKAKEQRAAELPQESPIFHFDSEPVMEIRFSKH